jgi:predicted anti-sigma-YlaC factor YlaD
MLERHLTRDEVEQYLLGALDPEVSARLEAHTLVCEPCAGLLQQEALLEEQLREVAASLPGEALAPVLRPARWRRVAATLVGPALATAAAVGLLVLRAPPATRPAAPVEVAAEALELPRVVACPDMATQDACASAAAERGLMVQYPQGVGEVPRYEGYAGLPAGALRARGPAPL